jgi:hypothetical protein
MIQHKQTNKEITEFRKKLKYIFGNFCIHTTNNSKMSLALLLENAIPKGYKMVGGKLVRKHIKILRPLFVLANGLSTDYNGYFGILPDGVFQYIFQIATEMLEHEKKVEWNNRLAWSHTNGVRPMSCFGIPATDGCDMMGVGRFAWEEGDILYNAQNGGWCGGVGWSWWRVHKKTPKTVVLRVLETERERVVADTRPNKYRGNDDYVCSKYARLTGEYTKGVFGKQKIININRKLPFGFHRDIRLYKSEWGNMPKTLADCAGRWVEMVEMVKSTPLSKGFNC